MSSIYSNDLSYGSSSSSDSESEHKTTKCGNSVFEATEQPHLVRLSKKEMRELKKRGTSKALVAAEEERERQKDEEERLECRRLLAREMIAARHLREALAEEKQREDALVEVRWSQGDSSTGVIASFGSSESRVGLDKSLAREMKQRMLDEDYFE